jgi:hypothetical protein
MTFMKPETRITSKNKKIAFGLMLSPGFTVLISIQLIFVEHRHVPIFNTKKSDM